MALQRKKEMEGDDRIKVGLDIANLWRLDFPLFYGSLQFEAICGPSLHSDFQEKYLGVCTLGGRMYFTFTFDETFIDKGTMEEIKDTAMEYLAKAITTKWINVHRFTAIFGARKCRNTCIF